MTGFIETRAHAKCLERERKLVQITQLGKDVMDEKMILILVRLRKNSNPNQ